MTKRSPAEKVKKMVPRSTWMWGFSCEFLLPKDMIDLKVPELMKELNFGLFL